MPQFKYFTKSKKIFLTSQHIIYGNTKYNKVPFTLEMSHQPNKLLTMQTINSLPQGYLHSKLSFLKSIVTQEHNPEIRQMKERMFKISYTIKNIGIHGQQIGITSKRMPLKGKEDYKPGQITSEKSKQIYKKKYLPQNSFYSQAFIPVKKPKIIEAQQQKRRKNPFLVTSSNFNINQFSQTFTISPETKFSKKMSQSKLNRNFSLAQRFRVANRNPSTSKQDQFMQKITTRQKASSVTNLKQNMIKNKKSYSKLLTQFNQRPNKQIELLPLQHDQNILFKKFKKLQQISTSIKQDKTEKIMSSRGLSRNSSTFVGRYNSMVSTARNFQVKRKSSKME